MRTKFHTLSIPTKVSIWQSEFSDEQKCKKQHNTYSRSKLDDFINEKPDRLKTISDLKMSQVINHKRKLAQPANIAWMYTYKSQQKLHKLSFMNEYLKSIIEENKLKPSLEQLSHPRNPYINHKDFINDKYVQRKKLFRKPQKFTQTLQ
ncbi:unnamed protein product [Paramecium octaurelia]|uniref:Uncharacterized protein n=1 Tax=Paramecium octaurelia TaxID=43137 RepID=A0A8S1SSN2_PAROT|nr:unnamed protein product [Paramecium octaurelia]CAD8142416.1 unnamed protein product [Paramecium octaurelia]